MPTFLRAGGNPVATSPCFNPPPYSGEFGCGTPGWARQKAVGSRQQAAVIIKMANLFRSVRYENCFTVILPSAFRFLPSAFCFLPSAFCLLPSAFCLLCSAACLLLCQLLQNFFLRFFDRHAIALA